MLILAFTFAAAALGGGLIAGTWIGMRPKADIGVGQSFLIWLALASAAFTTFAKSMEALPLALLFATLIGFIPFSLGHFVLRAAVARLRKRETLPAK